MNLKSILLVAYTVIAQPLSGAVKREIAPIHKLMINSVMAEKYPYVHCNAIQFLLVEKKGLRPALNQQPLSIAQPLSDCMMPTYVE